MSDLSWAVATELAQRRKELGLTLEEVGDLADLHRTSVGLVERHRRSLTIDAADRLARALGLQLSEVIARAEKVERA